MVTVPQQITNLRTAIDSLPRGQIDKLRQLLMRQVALSGTWVGKKARESLLGLLLWKRLEIERLDLGKGFLGSLPEIPFHLVYQP